ncbi:MAG: MBL fold metallo-hydrolase [Gemmatimonadota bacterium]|nr:MBL fold metallo-hydrolase [Gemmatimonadota bacterium]
MRLLRFGTLAFVGALQLGLATHAEAQHDSDSIPLELHFLDVGQGDATLIKYGNIGVLVDAGRGDDIVLVLEDLGIDSLVAAVASHNHDDHIGGMDAVLADFPVGHYLYNGRPAENDNAEAIEDILAEEGIDNPEPPWEPIALGDARITVFPSPLDPDDATENTSSLGVLVERGRFRALLTGDSEVEELDAWLEAGVIPRVNVLKAAHHGARNGVTPGWLDRTRPEVVVISVGASNSYGHPDPWAMRYYRSHQRTVLRTDQDGTVIVTVDREGGYTLETTGPVDRSP